LFRKHFRVKPQPIQSLPTNSIKQHMEFDPPDMPAAVAQMQHGGRNALDIDPAATNSAGSHEPDGHREPPTDI
jgi:hypothetical protein